MAAPWQGTMMTCICATGFFPSMSNRQRSSSGETGAGDADAQPLRKWPRAAAHMLLRFVYALLCWADCITKWSADMISGRPSVLAVPVPYPVARP
jgi:hypothetical protein